MLVSRRRRVGRRVPAALAALVLVDLAVGWRTKIRRSGDLADYRDLLVNDTGEPGAGAVRVTASGTTMMLVDDGETQILIDPFVSTVGLLEAALDRPVSTDPAAVDAALERIGADRVRAILVSHSHFDHALDVAYVARRTGARVYGSTSTLNIARGGDVPEARLRLLEPGEPVAIGGFEVLVVASRHSPDPLGGEGATIDEPLEQPTGIRAYKEGGTYDFLVFRPGPDEVPRMLFKGSANWVPGALEGLEVDALFLGIAGLGKADQDFADGYLEATMGTVDPSIVVPTHWNDVFAPVRPDLPLQRKAVDDTPAAFDRLLDRAALDGIRVGLLDAYDGIVLGAD